MLNWAKKFSTWFHTQPMDRKVQVILLIALSVFLAGEAFTFGVVWVASLQEGLSLHVETDTPSIILEQGTEETLQYAVALKNAPFCKATCEIEVIDHRTGARLIEDQGRIRTTARTIEVNVSASKTGRKNGVVQLAVHCENEDRFRCQRQGENARMTASISISEIYPTGKEQELQDLQEVLPRWLSTREQRIADLQSISELQDVRATIIAQSAGAQKQQVELKIGLVQNAIAEERFGEALRELNTAVSTPAIQDYATLRLQEQIAVERIESVVLERNRIESLGKLWNAPQAREFEDLLGTLYAQAQTFSTTPPQDVLDTVDRLQPLLMTNVSGIVRDVRDAQHSLQTAHKQQCTLFGTICTQEMPIITLTEATQHAQRLCSEIFTRNASIAIAKASYVKSLGMNETIQQAEIRLNVQGIRTASGWGAREQEILAAAANGSLSANPGERLAVTFSGISENICPIPGRDLLVPVIPEKTLPMLNGMLRPHTIEFPQVQCCTSGVCKACTANTTPVLFVHGHSFAERSAPEFNLQAFTDMAWAFQNDGRLFAGSVFPQTTEKTQIYHGDVSLTTTYYYDSFAEQGVLQLIPRKSERIETYAIRLHEAVRSVQTVTGEDKIIIVAHSMGGLVVRRYLQLFGEGSVSGVVLVGTPNTGITKRTQQVCPVVGADLECQDMEEGSVFLRKLNAEPPPTIPVLVIAGTGCDGRAFDGVVDTENVLVPWADQLIVEGTCDGKTLLHSELVDPLVYPDVYSAVRDFVTHHSG